MTPEPKSARAGALLRDLLEAENVREEADGAIEIGDGQTDLCDGTRRGGVARPGRDDRRGQQRKDARYQGTAWSRGHPSLAARWSPTRSALAMIVNAGFTALLDAKNPPSTT